jgi:hypothetical protein
MAVNKNYQTNLMEVSHSELKKKYVKWFMVYTEKSRFHPCLITPTTGLLDTEYIL